MFLIRWADGRMQHSPEIMADFLYSLTGPKVLKRTAEAFQEAIS
jgi:hypothetical protein